ncbi:DUF6031 family protein [Streptomyces sp. NPDC054766]|uniref:DUF6031 family protein n=1 Tax=Streptomyces rhizosphaerihabitans TaxID=1266770 RepID=UPI0021C02168|nr:DUF6031 family protein [Streptomyces rhizosphaerihabitans]MCT9008513.1 DUF6031 family protein [Streptomyces rhizosphaerihabitans]
MSPAVRESLPEAAREVTVLPGVRAGHVLPAAHAVETWVQVAWLMLAEGRAYVEDLEGGVEQPQMQQSAKLRLLEQLADIDQRLAGRVPSGDAHCLALALEYGLHELVGASGPELVEIFGLDEEFGADSCRVDQIFVLWERLLEEFPGELPDRLVAQGQRDMLVTLRAWAGLARGAGLDIGFLTPFIKDA